MYMCVYTVYIYIYIYLFKNVFIYFLVKHTPTVLFTTYATPETPNDLHLFLQSPVCHHLIKEARKREVPFQMF